MVEYETRRTEPSAFTTEWTCNLHVSYIDFCLDPATVSLRHRSSLNLDIADEIGTCAIDFDWNNDFSSRAIGATLER